MVYAVGGEAYRLDNAKIEIVVSTKLGSVIATDQAPSDVVKQQWIR